MISRLSKLLSALDKITLAYISWVLVLLLSGGAKVQDFPLQFPIFLSLGVAILLLAYYHHSLDASHKPRLFKALQLLHELYPVLLFAHFFTSGYAYNRIFFADWQDPFFMKIDQALFGYLPSMEWGQRFNGFWANELFHFAYFAYYPMIAGLPLYLYFTNRLALKELIFCLSFSFYLCYFFYSLLPVIGGRYLPEAMELTRIYRAGIFTRIMVFIYRHSHHLGGAFPSSHVAIAIVLTIGALRHVRKLGYLFSFISFFLCLATVYCHYHWFIDAIMGIFTGIGAYYLALALYRKLQGTPA